jgi:hypothetical protein
MKRKELAVTANEMIMIDQRAPAPSWNMVSGSFSMHPYWHSISRASGVATAARAM